MAEATAQTTCKTLQRVRVEDDTSIGRSYSKAGELVPGIGAQRRALRTTVWRDAYWPQNKTLESYTLAKTHLSKASKEDIMAYFENTWHLTDTLFCSFRDDSVFYSIPDKLRRPLIFYSAHPAALYVNKMHQAGLLDKINPFFEKLFETGVDEMSWDSMEALQHEDYCWPEMSEVVAFRAQVKEAVKKVIRDMPDPRECPISMESPYWSLVMGFEHERIHIETSAVLIHQLPIESVLNIPGWKLAPSFALDSPDDAPKNALVEVSETTVALGKPRNFPSFGWDNEYGTRVVKVPSFKASAMLVSNAEFLPFVLAGGYIERKWWVSPQGDDEGWRWRCFRNATHPSFWVATSHPEQKRFWGGKPDYPYQKDDGHPRAGNDNAFKLRVMFDIVDMPWDWPVEVNNLEAAAFLRWKSAQEQASPAAAAAEHGGPYSYRIPTEAEYHALRGDPSPAAIAKAAAAGALALNKQQTKELALLDKDGSSLAKVDVGAGVALAGNHQHNAKVGSSSNNNNNSGVSATSAAVDSHAKYHAGHHDLHEHLATSLKSGFSLQELKKIARVSTLSKSVNSEGGINAKVDPSLPQEEYVRAVAETSAKKGRVPTSAVPSAAVAIPDACNAAATKEDDKASAELDLYGRVLLPDGTAVDKSNYQLEAKARDALSLLDGVDADAAVDVIMQPAAPGNLNLRWGSSTPVNFYPPSATGFHDTHGNVWQWVEDHFAPLPGFEIHFLYDDFSAPCFDGWHTEILGGSWVSTGDEASSFSRFHFRRHFFQHLGFRYVALPSSAKEAFPGASTVINLWEGMSTVNNGLTNGYLPLSEKVPYAPALLSVDSAANYGSNLASFVARTYSSLHKDKGDEATKAAKVLHLGCGHFDVGATSFELVRAGFASVTGVDDNEPSIRHARLLQHHAQFEYERVDEGILTSTTLGKIQGGLAPADRAKVSFFLGDITSASAGASATTGLGPEVLAAAPYDAIVVDDLLVRSTQPLDLLAKIPLLVKKGGLVVFTSTNNWDPAVTPRNSWLGGFKMNGEPLTTNYLLKYHLGRHGFVPASTPAAAAAVSATSAGTAASAETSVSLSSSVTEIARLKRKNARAFDLDVLEVTAFVKTTA